MSGPRDVDDHLAPQDTGRGASPIGPGHEDPVKRRAVVELAPDLQRLWEELQALHRALRGEKRARWNRSLPFEDELFDRWERARCLGFGEGSSIYQQSYVFGDVKVGRHTWIGPLTVLDGSGGIEIGDFCSISSGVHIYSHDSVKWALSGGKVPYERAPVKIGNCCYVGSDTVITKGVTIGDHCLVAACAFVNKNLPAFTIAAGVPCRLVGWVELVEGDVRLNYRPRGEQTGDAS